MKLKQLAAPCVPERHVVIYIMLRPTVGDRSNKDCRAPFLIGKVKTGGGRGGGYKTSPCACLWAPSCLQDQPQDDLHEHMFRH